MMAIERVAVATAIEALAMLSRPAPMERVPRLRLSVETD